MSRIDREYVLAGLAGLLLEKKPVADYVAKYDITRSEQRRAACVVMQQIMQGGVSHKGPKAIQRVEELAREYGFNKDEITSAAWEVLRGTFDKDHSEPEEVAWHVLNHFLRDRLPKGPSFGYTGLADSFKPDDGEGLSSYLVMDLIYHSLDSCIDPTGLPTELQELLRDLGLE